ncbi:MAG: hypothetical protein ABIP95_04815 [Pelobium sp.]
MKKFLALTLFVTALGFAACTNDKKSDKEIDSLNQAGADSLLNAAMSDTTAIDNIDTLKVDTTVIQ